MINNTYIKIKDIEIPIKIKNFKNSKTIRIFFRGNVLHICKPLLCTYRKVEKLLKQNEESIYNEFLNIIDPKSKLVNFWNNGETFLYRGNDFKIINTKEKVNSYKIVFDKNNRIIKIINPIETKNDINKKEYIDKKIKKILKEDTENILSERVPYWSKKTNIDYNSFKVRDSITRYGSCTPKTRDLRFSSRLIMLPENVIDSIIVHELCHIKIPNHSKEFYDLVNNYFNDYETTSKWLRVNKRAILF